MDIKTKIIIIITAIAIIAGGVYFAIQNQQNEDVFSMISDSVFKIDKMDATYEMSLSVETDDPNSEMIKEVLKDLMIKFEVKQDIGLYKSELKILLDYKNETALEIYIYFDKENIIINAPLIYDKPFYLSTEELNDYIVQETGQIENTFDMNKMMEFSKEFYSLDNVEGIEDLDVEKYKKLINTNLDGMMTQGKNIEVKIVENNKEKKISCKELLFNFNEKQLIDFIISIMEEAQNDENVKNIILAKLEQYKELNQDMYKNNEMLEQNDYKQMINEIKNNYSKGMKDKIEQLKSMKKELEEDLFLADSIVGIDKDGYIRYLESNINIKTIEDPTVDSVELKFKGTINSYNKELTYNIPENYKEESVNLMNIIKDPEGQEMQKVMMYMMGSLMQEMYTNPLLQVLSQESGVF